MLKKILKIFLVPLILAVVFLPHTASAVTWFPLVPCGLNSQPAGIPKTDHDYTQDCNQCLLVELGKNVIDMTSFAIVPAIGTLLFLWAGFRILFGAREGNPAVVKEGTKIMTATAIGIALILGAWLITNFILRSIATEQVANTPWYQIQCRVGTLKDIVDGTQPSVPTNGGGTTGPDGGTGTGGPDSDSTPAGSGGQCVFNNVDYGTTNLCSGIARPGGCGTNTCSQYLPSIQKYANGAATAAVLKAFMVVESDCNINAGSGTSFGLMQLTPQYAAPFAPQCGVAAGSITSSWLKDPANADKSICLAAAYINGVSAGKCGNDPAHLYAGYNGSAAKACAASVDCTAQSCSSGPTQAWECPYNDTAHTQCNTGYYQTKQGSSYVSYCINHMGF